MDRKSEIDFRAQNEELKRLRQQNLISIRKNEKSIEACSELIRLIFYRTIMLQENLKKVS